MRVSGLIASATVALGLAGSASAQDPVLVELFTSQGCSACPPADALLAELATRDDVIALALHVDYWNYLGWQDIFSTPANTRRQRAHIEALGGRVVFTPDIVVNGAASMIGSRRAEVLAAIEQAKATPAALAVEVRHEGSAMVADITPRGETETPARVLYFVYETPVTVEVTRGENAGRRLTYHNAVRSWSSLGDWSGEAQRFEAPVPQDALGVAVVVERISDGRVLGAGRYEFPLAAATAALP